jgi:hypothetical protein
MGELEAEEDTGGLVLPAPRPLAAPPRAEVPREAELRVVVVPRAGADRAGAERDTLRRAAGLLAGAGLLVAAAGRALAAAAGAGLLLAAVDGVDGVAAGTAAAGPVAAALLLAVAAGAALAAGRGVGVAMGRGWGETTDGMAGLSRRVPRSR